MRLLHYNCAAAEHGTIEAIAVSTAKFCGRAAARASAAVISLARNRSVAISDVPEEEFDDFIIDDDTMPRKVFSLLKLFYQPTSMRYIIFRTSNHNLTYSHLEIVHSCRSSRRWERPRSADVSMNRTQTATTVNALTSLSR
jgi:hypothetical protein